MNNYNDWIMDRCGKITASEIYKIMGKGRSKDAYFGQLAETYMLSKIAEILTLEPNNGGRVNTDAMDPQVGSRSLEQDPAPVQLRQRVHD